MVRIAYRSLSKVVGTGSIVISEKSVLQSVLLVPNLTCNLLFVSKLTRDLKYVANFSLTCCLFQDLASGGWLTMLRSVRYFISFKWLKIQENKLKLQGVCRFLFFPCLIMKVLLCCGTIGLGILISCTWKDFSQLYSIKSMSNYFSVRCVSCQSMLGIITLSKVINHHNYFSLFTMIYGDYLGVNNISGSLWFILFIDDHILKINLSDDMSFESLGGLFN